MRWQLVTYENVLSSKNGQPISDPYFYHCKGAILLKAKPHKGYAVICICCPSLRYKNQVDS